MNNFIRFLFLFLFFHIPLSSNEVPEKIVSNFYSLYNERGIEPAIDYLFSNNPVLYSKGESIHNLKQTILNIEKVLGKINSYSVLKNVDVNDSLKVIITFVKYEKQPLRFLFVFYKPDKKWMTYRFEIDTSFPDNWIDAVFKNHDF